MSRCIHISHAAQNTTLDLINCSQPVDSFRMEQFGRAAVTWLRQFTQPPNPSTTYSRCGRIIQAATLRLRYDRIDGASHLQFTYAEEQTSTSQLYESNNSSKEIFSGPTSHLKRVT